MEVKVKVKRSHSLNKMSLNYLEAKSLNRRSNSVSELVARYENVRQKSFRKLHNSERMGVGRSLPERVSLLKHTEEPQKLRRSLFQKSCFLIDDNGDKKEKYKTEPKTDKRKGREPSGSWQTEDLCKGTARMKLTASAERHQYEGLLSPTYQRSSIRGEFHRAQNSFIPSVRQRSELFLSKAAAAETKARNPKLKLGNKTDIYTSPPKKKEEKEREVCSTCLKPVYSMERTAFGKMILHQSCFCCSQCKQKLTFKNCFSVFGRLYCKVHHDQITQGGTAESSHEKSVAGSVPSKDLKKAKNFKEYNMAEVHVGDEISHGQSHGELHHTNQTHYSNDSWLHIAHIRNKGISRWSWPNLLSANNIPDTLEKGANRGVTNRFSGAQEMNLPKVPSPDGKRFQKNNVISEPKIKQKVVLFQTLKTNTNISAASPKGMKTSKMESLQKKYELACTKPAINSSGQPNTRLITTNFRDILSSPKSKDGTHSTESSHVLKSKASSVARPKSETIQLPKIRQNIKEPMAVDTPIPKNLPSGEAGIKQSMEENAGAIENEASLNASQPQEQLIQKEAKTEVLQLPPGSNSPLHEVSSLSQIPRQDQELEP